MASKKYTKHEENTGDTYGFESEGSDSEHEFYDLKFYNLCQSNSSSETLNESKETSKKTRREMCYNVSNFSRRKCSSGASTSINYIEKTSSPQRKQSNTRKTSMTTVRKKSNGQKKEVAGAQRKGEISKTLWDVVSKLKKIKLSRKPQSLGNPAEMKRSQSKSNVKRAMSKKSLEMDESSMYSTHTGKRPTMRKTSKTKSQGQNDEKSYWDVSSLEGLTRCHGRPTDQAISNWKIVQGAIESKPFNRMSSKSKLLPSIKRNFSTDEEVNKRSIRPVGKREYVTESCRRDTSHDGKYMDTQRQRRSPANYQQNDSVFKPYDPTESMSNSSFEYLCHYSPRKMPFSLSAIQSSLAQRRRYGESSFLENESTSSKEGLPTVFVEETSSRENSVSPPVEDIGFLSLPSSEPLSESSSSNSPCFFPKLYSSSDRSLSGTERFDSAVGLSPDMRAKSDSSNIVTMCDRGVSPVIFGKIEGNEKVLIPRQRVRCETFPRNESFLDNKTKSRSDPSGQILRGHLSPQSKQQGSNTCGRKQDVQKPNTFKKINDQLKGKEGLSRRDSQRGNLQDHIRESPAVKIERKQSSSNRRSDEKKHDSTLPPINFENKYNLWRK